MSGRASRSLGHAAVAAFAWAGLSSAQADEATPAFLPTPSIATSIPAIADPGGSRSALFAKGVQLQLNSVGEVLGNVGGGVHRGAIYDGFAELVIDADLAKSIGATGLTFHANAYQIHGAGLSRDNLDNLLVVSSLEALPSTRLQQAWLQQTFADGKVSVRVGQLAADAEFITSTDAGLFINSSFGWPALTAADLPSGGPAYPLAAPGIRLQVNPTDADALLLGLFDGDPAGPGAGDPQRRDPYGLNFRVTDPPLLIGEAQHKTTIGTGDAALSGVLKAGAFVHFGRFDDLRFGTDGRSLADPLGNADPVRHRSDYGIYGVLDQQVFRLPGDDATKGIGLFARVLATPQQDRNLIDAYVDGGVNVHGMVPGRGDDSFGVALGYARISDQARGLDIDTATFARQPLPIRRAELVVEATYSAQIVPGWTLQPDFQYVVHPGGGLANPLAPATPIRNAAVFGLRTTINY